MKLAKKKREKNTDLNSFEMWSGDLKWPAHTRKVKKSLRGGPPLSVGTVSKGITSLHIKIMSKNKKASVSVTCCDFPMAFLFSFRNLNI